MSPAQTPRSPARPVKSLARTLTCSLGLAVALTPVAQAKVEISFWNLFTGGDGQIMQEMVEKYNASQDRVQVNMTILPWGDPYYSKLLTATVGGSPPEVAIVHASRLRPYASGGLLMELNASVLQRIGVRGSDFFPAPWNSGQWQGRQYGIPLDIHPHALYYNTEHFAVAGFADRAPANGDELLNYAKKLTRDVNGDGKIDQWGYGFAGAREWFAAVPQFGGDLLTKDGKDVAFLDGSGAKALDYYARLIEAVGGRFGGVFEQRNLSILQTGPWQIGFFERAGVPFKTAPMPQIGPVTNATWADSHLLVIPAPVEKGSPEKLAAAFEFIRWLTENAYLWSRGAGHVPTKRSVVAGTDFLKLEHQRAFLESVNFARYYPQVGKSTQLEGAIHEAVWSAWDKRATPAAALENLARQIRTLLAEQ